MSGKKIHSNAMSGGQGNNTSLLRIGVIFLSIVSFYTTANGMRDYIFINNGVVAYAASAAIQGILLALSMNLPRYLRNIMHNEKKPAQQVRFDWKAPSFYMYLLGGIVRLPIKLTKAACAVILTAIIIFCSSWFSYIYIADTLHKDSWDSDSELLVQQIYRTELYDARDYAHNYRVYLEERVGERILQLDEQAKELSGDGVGSTINWEDEKNDYVTNNGVAAASYMSVVIDAVKLALETDASQNERDLAVTAIADAKTNIAERMEAIQQNLDTIDANITKYNAQITNLENQINRAVEGTDTAALYNSINNYTKLIEDTSKRQQELQLEYLQLDSALLRLPYYEVELGLSSSTSYISIRRKLLQLQTEFFKTDLDEDKLLDAATEIFEDLRNAANAAVNGETSEDSFSYTNLLVQMNQLIVNLKDYITVKNIESELDRLIADLHNENMEDGTDPSLIPEENVEAIGSDEPNNTGNSVETISSEETPDDVDLDEGAESTELEEQTESNLLTENDSEEVGLLTDSDSDTEAAPSAEMNLSAADADLSESEPSDGESGEEDEKIEEGTWKDEWGNRIDDLKAKISAMPKYSPEKETDNETESEKVKVLTESQISVLENYDRDVASRTLDDTIRRYVSERSPVYKGIIYLQSPYSSLALFALLLAVSFDLAGFIFGFVEQDNTQQNRNSDVSDSNETGDNNQKNEGEQTNNRISKSDTNGLFIPKKRNVKNVLLTDNNRKTEWSILKTLAQYIVLTGDYESRDGIYYYKAFKDGVLCDWEVKDTVPYTQGIYIQEEIDREWTKGVTLPKDGQELLFSGQEGGPKDGIYMNCQLIYDEGSLILTEGDQKKFLANIDEYVPVHSYKPSQGENRTIPSKQLTKKGFNDQSIVVALNEKGTRIVAIYIVEHL